jgi:sensor histidine kinase YesM
MNFFTYLKGRLRVIPWLIVGGLVMTYFECRNCRVSPETFLVVSSFIVTSWFFMWFGNEYLSEYISSKIAWTKAPLKRFVWGIVVTIVYTVAAITALIYFFEALYNRNFSSVEDTLLTTLGVTLILNLFMTGRSFLINWRKTIVEAEKFQKESAVAKYESLKNQVNPHFLFNSFNALSNLVYEDPDKAVKFIKQLSDVYRYVLDTRDKEAVNLEDEHQFLKAYLFLQQIRFGEKLKLDVRLNDVKSMVAPLVLQMLVENAIKHNEISEDNPLTIRVYEDAGYIAVQNNLQKKSLTLEDSPGIGLDNIVKRYAFLSDKKVEIRQDDCFLVKLPIIPISAT